MHSRPSTRGVGIAVRGGAGIRPQGVPAWAPEDGGMLGMRRATGGAAAPKTFNLGQRHHTSHRAAIRVSLLPGASHGPRSPACGHRRQGGQSSASAILYHRSGHRPASALLSRRIRSARGHTLPAMRAAGRAAAERRAPGHQSLALELGPSSSDRPQGAPPPRGVAPICSLKQGQVRDTHTSGQQANTESRPREPPRPIAGDNPA